MKAKDEIAALRGIIKDIHWMARRYADGRQTYATGMLNDATRQALRMGVDLGHPNDGTFFARDGGGRSYDRLSPEEAAEDHPPFGGNWVNEEITRLRKIINHTEQTLAAALDFPKWGENPVGANPEEYMVVIEDVTLLAEMAAKQLTALRALPVTGGKWPDRLDPTTRIYVPLLPIGLKPEGATLGEVWDANVKEKHTTFSYKEPTP